MLAIAAQESHCGKYFAQLQGGPAQSVWQVEPATLEDLYKNYLAYKPRMRVQLQKLLPTAEIVEPLLSCPLYSCGVARLCLYRQPDPLPVVGDREGMWALYKRYFNSHLGAATKEEWDRNWTKYVEGVDVQ